MKRGGLLFTKWKKNEKKKIEKKNEQWKWLFSLVKFLGIPAYLLFRLSYTSIGNKKNQGNEMKWWS